MNFEKHFLLISINNRYLILMNVILDKALFGKQSQTFGCKYRIILLIN